MSVQFKIVYHTDRGVFYDDALEAQQVEREKHAYAWPQRMSKSALVVSDDGVLWRLVADDMSLVHVNSIG